MTEYVCFFANRPDAGPCSGQLRKCHLAPRSLLKREYRYGAVFEDGAWRPLGRTEDHYELPFRSVDDLIRDPRSWVAMCGGLGMGNTGHHGIAAPDGWQLPIFRDELPESFLEFMEELGLLWFVLRTYPERATVAGMSRHEQAT